MLRIWAAMPSSGRAMSVILPLAGLGEPLFEQGTFGGVAGEAERLFIGAARLGGVPPSAMSDDDREIYEWRSAMRVRSTRDLMSSLSKT